MLTGASLTTLAPDQRRSGADHVKALITGGAGFIGSTIASACLDAGHTPVVLDDLSTGRQEFVAGRPFYPGDVRDGDLVHRVFDEHPDIEAVVHCAARIVVPESMADPLGYYANNVGGLVGLLGHLAEVGCRRVVFSSSASIYAPSDDLTVDESSPLAPTSPYARTKMVDELVLADTAASSDLRVVSLRYFNPVGADPSMRTGLQVPEPSHALGRLIQAHQQGRPFTVTGVDWPTRDGSGIRDYLHVWDLAQAHVAVLGRFDTLVTDELPSRAINLGTGTGTTVRELVAAFERVTGAALDVVEGPPRPGDVAGCYTLSDVAARELGWATGLGLDVAISHSLEWARRRPGLLGV